MRQRENSGVNVMFLLKGHGTNAVLSGNTDAYSNKRTMSAEAACGFSKGTYVTAPRTGHFDYYFPDAEGLPADCAEMTKALDELADATIENANPPKNSTIAPVFTYFGQFIDHDITANTDREGGLSTIDEHMVKPLPRIEVSNGVGNLRFAAMDLDSVYGGGFEEGDISRMLRKALRSPRLPAKMEVGVDSKVPGEAALLPADDGRDLLRLDWAMRSGQVDIDVLRKGPKDILDQFFHNGNPNTPNLSTAIIGDARNDENLAVAQFHLAILRLHNKIVDKAPSDVQSKGHEATYIWARCMTRWIYQWLVRHAYLPAVCDATTLSNIQERGPVLYDSLIASHPATGDILPMPLEFSVSAFRFGHSMARERYDWNRIFSADKDNRATFELLFRFTGKGDLLTQRLPSNWPISWDRFVHDPGNDDERSALKIDTGLNKHFERMHDVKPGMSGAMAHLARRNLRRGYRLSIPSAQGCLDALQHKGIELQKLTEEQLLEGHTSNAVKAGNFHKSTPLWFYILKEAEILNNGDSLGPLGTTLVADTLLGLLKHTPRSYINEAPGGESWMPADSVRPEDVSITDMASMMKAAGLR